jgi:uncharacterized membrane protein
MLNRFRRILKHRWLDAISTGQVISADMRQRLRQRIAASEQHHAGEIRIYIETGLPLSYLWRKASTPQITRQRALAMFGKLRVWDTAHNNGVLIYLLLAEHSIELVADRGLNAVVPPHTWQALVASMSSAFKAGQFEAGLTQALDEVSALLVQYFPLKEGEHNPNELPDSPVVN